MAHSNSVPSLQKTPSPSLPTQLKDTTRTQVIYHIPCMVAQTGHSWNPQSQSQSVLIQCESWSRIVLPYTFKVCTKTIHSGDIQFQFMNYPFQACYPRVLQTGSSSIFSIDCSCLVPNRKLPDIILALPTVATYLSRTPLLINMHDTFLSKICFGKCEPCYYTRLQEYQHSITYLQ